MNRRAFAQRVAVSVPALVALLSVASEVDAKQAGPQAPPPPTPHAPPERRTPVPHIGQVGTRGGTTRPDRTTI
jgi:hypothetical protein